MIVLKEANFEDIDKEWEFVKDMPMDENGLTNEWHGISREDFEKKALPRMIKDQKGIELPDWKVPQTFYFLWDNDTIVGQFRLRHYLNDALISGAGHIGYFIKKEFRGKGYATIGLKHLLEDARKIVPEDEIYLRVDKTNPASLRVMEKNGGHIISSSEDKFFVRIKRDENKCFRIVFVRHGEPDYVADCLTKIGNKQAEAASIRVKDEGISEIYSSPNGRARETAAYTAKLLNLPITTLDYMHEISWGGENISDGGHPWTLAEKLIDEENFDFYKDDWKKHPFFEKNVALDYYNMISKNIDELLLKYGYKHEGRRYLCDTDEGKTIALFSHGGSGASALSNILSLPFPYFCTVLPYDFTSIIIVNFPVQKGAYVHPRLELFNDARHIRDISSGLVIQKEVDRK